MTCEKCSELQDWLEQANQQRHDAVTEALKLRAELEAERAARARAEADRDDEGVARLKDVEVLMSIAGDLVDRRAERDALAAKVRAAEARCAELTEGLAHLEDVTSSCSCIDCDCMLTEQPEVDEACEQARAILAKGEEG